MSKKVLILMGSPRRNGNTSILCDEFARGTEDAGHAVEKINVVDKKEGGYVFGLDTTDIGTVKTKDSMKKAYEMGKAI